MGYSGVLPVSVTWHLCGFTLKGVCAGRVSDIMSGEGKAKARGLGHNVGLRDPQTRFRVQVGHQVSVETPKQQSCEWRLGAGGVRLGPTIEMKLAVGTDPGARADRILEP